MLSFAPNLVIEKELIRLQGSIHKTWNKFFPPGAAEAEYLHRQALISTIGASTRIENAVLTDPEIDWVDTAISQAGGPASFEKEKLLIVDKLSKDRLRSIEEVAGCREMLTTIYQQAAALFPLTESHIRGLHHDLLRYYPQAAQYAGGYKISPNKVVAYDHATGRQQTVLEPADPGIITKTAMSDLVAWYNATIKEAAWSLLVSVEFVFRFLAIHPFQDGNGRLGRGLFLLSLLHSDDNYLREILPFLAIDRQIERNKTVYYRVLRQTSNGKFHQDSGRYDYSPLARFFIKILEASLLDVEVYRTRFANLKKLTVPAEKVLDSFKSSPEKRLTVSGLETQTALPRRTIQYALKTLVEKGFIQRLGTGAASRYQLIF